LPFFFSAFRALLRARWAFLMSLLAVLAFFFSFLAFLLSFFPFFFSVLGPARANFFNLWRAFFRSFFLTLCAFFSMSFATLTFFLSLTIVSGFATRSRASERAFFAAFTSFFALLRDGTGFFFTIFSRGPLALLIALSAILLSFLSGDLGLFFRTFFLYFANAASAFGLKGGLLTVCAAFFALYFAYAASIFATGAFGALMPSALAFFVNCVFFVFSLM